ncbi:ABC transporter substrate-binding protein [Actinomadura litoris]|uniref:ABC transporter substrate-binding protein n=1 Tax=Actinomadura litoris TaxID=2678616 RepID=UPI001FA6C62D|nr:ABC transporter substrate-binding protein [Actinomadura litoris]
MAGDRVLGEDRLRGVLDLFERLRERPPRRHGDRLRPLLMLLGPKTGTSPVAKMFGTRCKNEKAPYSHIAEEHPPADVPGVLRQAKRELSQPGGHRPGEPALRFPLLDMALWLNDLRDIRLAGDEHRPPSGAAAAERENHQLVRKVTHPPIVDDENARRRELNRVIRRRGRDLLGDLETGPRGRPATFLGFLEQIAPIGVAIVALVSAGTAATLDLAYAVVAAVVGLVFVTLQIVARTRGWYGVRRFGWFLRQPYLADDPPGFLGFALGVFDPRPVEDAEHRERLDLLLIAAFLEDLRRNYHRDVRRAAWARVRYPVLIFEHLPPGHAGVRFLELLARVRRDGRDRRGRPAVDPLVVTAGVDPAEPADPSDPSGGRLVDRIAAAFRLDLGGDDPASAPGARELWDRHREEEARVNALGARRVLRVDVTRDPGGNLPPVRPARRRPRFAHPALPWIAMVAIAASSVTVVSVVAVRYCSAFQIRRTSSGECIGITDGGFKFGEVSEGENNDNRLSPVLARLERQNRAVARSGKPHATIVYLGPVTADPAIKNRQLDLLAGAQGELLGLTMAQAEFNNASPYLRLRVLVANAGARFQHARQVAEQIRDLALRDRSIVTVVGFEQSRVETQDAIKVLSKATLPMVGTANSYNETGRLDRGAGFSPYYFRLAPPNTRLAEHAAYWARTGRVGGRPARTVDVISSADPHDLYSRDLAESFTRAFTRAPGGGKVLARRYENPGDLDRTVHELCERPPDLFYYAGRSDEFRSFANVLQHTCPSGQAVLADDEIAKYVADNAPELGRIATFRLYYMPLAAHEAWTDTWVGDRRNVFFNSYPGAVASMFGATPSRDRTPSEVRAAVSYDAASMIAYLANQVFTEQAAVPAAGGVFAALDDPGKGPLWQGASGVLQFTGRAQGHQVTGKPVLLATVRPDGTVEVTEVCGRLVASGQKSGHCPPAATAPPPASPS